jgi:Ca2+-transporting ATPase
MKERGLTQEEAEKNLEKFGLNEIKEISKNTPLKTLLHQVKNNFIIYILAFAVAISFFVGKHVTAYVVLAVIFMVIFVGFIQEYKAEKAISALKSMLVPISIVMRDGKEQEIPSMNIVPGDILILRNGEKIPADCLLIEEKELRVDESILTGESRDIGKKIGSEKNYTDENLVFMGTYIVNGRCVARVLHTGMNTKFGKIAGLISTTEKELPLQKKVNKIAKYMVVLAITISFLTGLIMILRSRPLNEEVILNTLILMIALSVSAFPEGFPVVLITTLASGASHMAKKNAIVNRMSIIETLGETTVICSDKTGTITRGEMTVKKIFADKSFFDVTGVGYEGKGDFLFESKKVNISKEPVLKTLINSAVLCNDAEIERTGEDMEFKAIGSPTEAALLVLGAKAGLFKSDMKFERVQEMPFNSERKIMSVMCEINKEKTVYSKGAPEYILAKCKFIQRKDGIFKLTEREKDIILESNSEMNSNCLRTIALAYKKIDFFAKEHFEDDLVFIGLAGMEDPAREEVKEAIAVCFGAGIKVKMITGDHKATAVAIAKQVGLEGKVMEGSELDNISDEELPKIINSISIFARVRPEHKLRIVKALKANGEIVTMTGDGVNDAPALKEAHIGIAMGKNGTDVSRSVADLTLKDDNFSTIVSAIREGRTIFKNIRKFATYQLSCNLAELSVLFFGVLLAPLLGWQIPILLALQILFMNLVTDNLPAITLGLNPASSDSMAEPPRKNSKILTKPLTMLLIFNGFLMALFVLAAYFLSFNIFKESADYSRTVALFSLIGLEIMAAFSFRSFRKRVLKRSLLVNPYLFYASMVSLAATILIVYTPLNKLFGTTPLRWDGLIIVVIISLISVIIFDVLKYINKKKNFFNLEHV